MAIDLDEACQGASGLLEKPCSFDRAAPGGGEGEGFNSMLFHAGNQVLDCLVANRIVDVQVFVAAVFGSFVSSPDALLGAA